MYTFLLIFHVIVSIFLILVVLLQQGKGADMGAAFGGSSQTLFGSSGSTGFLGKLTTGAAVTFMITSLILSSMSSNSGSDSVIPDLETEQPVAEQTLPAEEIPVGEEDIANRGQVEENPDEAAPLVNIPVKGQ